MTVEPSFRPAELQLDFYRQLAFALQGGTIASINPAESVRAGGIIEAALDEAQ